jgi:hypothetical protein
MMTIFEQRNHPQMRNANTRQETDQVRDKASIMNNGTHVGDTCMATGHEDMSAAIVQKLTAETTVGTRNSAVIRASTTDRRSEGGGNNGGEMGDNDSALAVPSNLLSEAAPGVVSPVRDPAIFKWTSADPFGLLASEPASTSSTTTVAGASAATELMMTRLTLGGGGAFCVSLSCCLCCHRCCRSSHSNATNPTMRALRR